MPRKARLEVEAGIRHVYARGNDRQAIFRSDRDHETYLDLLALSTTEREWRCLAYCLMPNHVHLLIETTQPNLGSGMRDLQGRYVQTFNRRHSRTGHLFQGRYGMVPVTTDAQLWMTAAYIAANPVRAGLCARPEKWPWSSHAATLGGACPRWLDVPRLLEHLAGLGGDPRPRYAAFVHERLAAV